MTENLWARRMEELQRDRLKAFEQYAKRVDNAQHVLEHLLGVLDARAEALLGRQDDLTVLVRKTPGPKVTVYHSSDRACGRVNGPSRSRTSYREILESEAAERGLKRCSACGWPRQIPA